MSTPTAIVTGYSSGLGWSFTRQLLERGWDVVGVSRATSPEKGDPGTAGRLRTVVGNVADDDTVKAAFSAAAAAGDLRLVISCAGTGVFGAIGEYSANDVQTAVDGNLTGLILFTDRAAVTLGDGGTIVNVMSTASKKLRPAESVYTAVKWAAKAYTRTVREALKAKKSKVRVIEVYPCGMNTPFWDRAVRPVADGKAFPSSDPIAEVVLQGVLRDSDSYQQEFTFERS